MHGKRLENHALLSGKEEPLIDQNLFEEMRMVSWLKEVWQTLVFGGREVSTKKISSAPRIAGNAHAVELDIAADDPLLPHLARLGSLADLSNLDLDTPAVRSLRQAGVKIVVPLINQGELIGLLSLGRRLSEQEYSVDDRQLLVTLAAQASPSLRVAQLVKRQRSEERQRERLEQELRVARIVQETLLPKQVPDIPNWRISAHWQPARAVSGDFYDFFHFPDGKLGLVIADVTDKGIPAALVMATTRNMLRTTAERLVSPGKVLAETNNLLCPDIPMSMFVTCLYALLDPINGHLVYANAGHPPPYQRGQNRLIELRARGMPLGLMPDMVYEEKEADIRPGESVIMYSDGLLEAHNPEGDMFGLARIRDLLAIPDCGEELIQCMLGELTSFTRPGWEQEDDVTFVCLDMLSYPFEYGDGSKEEDERLLAEFLIPSEPGNEKTAMGKVAEAVQGLNFPPNRLERLKTATAEAVMNAIEHGNKYRADTPVHIFLLVSRNRLRIEIIDYNGAMNLPEPEIPDLESKIQGLQAPRGWGRFLIKQLADEMNDYSDGIHHTLELVFNLPEEL
jgi:serine phosphatase RsbU (regulator of sigma subunit)/anti-sigma regulatory factor (Ser/Thr protein kinase)